MTGCRESSPIARSTGSASELARSTRRASTSLRQIPPASKTAKSDAVNLFEQTGARNAGQQFGLDRSRIDLVRRHTHRFLMAIHESGYDEWPKMPVLIDWNLGNFSVEFERRRPLAVPSVQPLGLRLVPDRVAPARLLLPVARLVTHR